MRGAQRQQRLRIPRLEHQAVVLVNVVPPAVTSSCSRRKTLAPRLRLPVSRQAQTTSPGGSLLRRPLAESSTGVDSSRLGLGDRRRVAHDRPDPFAPVLAVDEVAPGAGGHDPDAVPLQLGVSDIAHLAAGPKGVDPALSEADGWHDRASPICCGGVRNQLDFRTRWQ